MKEAPLFLDRLRSKWWCYLEDLLGFRRIEEGLEKGLIIEGLVAAISIRLRVFGEKGKCK